MLTTILVVLIIVWVAKSLNKNAPFGGSLFAALYLLPTNIDTWLCCNFPSWLKRYDNQLEYNSLADQIRENNDIVYYVVEKYTNNNNVLSQYVSIYLPYKNTLEDVTILLNEYTGVNCPYGETRKYRGCLVFHDMIIYTLEKATSKVYGKPVKFVRIDEDMVNI